MRFWDSSALLPLFADEASRNGLLQRLDEDSEVLFWWSTPLEIAAALARRERDGLLTGDQVSATLTAVRTLAAGWHEILPSDAVRRSAERLLRTHPLRTAESLQLAAALVAADHDPATLTVVSVDERLNAAARREGFVVLGA